MLWPTPITISRALAPVAGFLVGSGILLMGYSGVMLLLCGVCLAAYAVKDRFAAGVFFSVSWCVALSWTLRSVGYIYQEYVWLYKCGMILCILLVGFIVSGFVAQVLPWWYSKKYTVCVVALWWEVSVGLFDLMGLTWVSIVDMLAASDIAWAQGCAYVGKRWLSAFLLFVLSWGVSGKVRKRALLSILVCVLAYLGGKQRLVHMDCQWLAPSVGIVHTNADLSLNIAERDRQLTALVRSMPHASSRVLLGAESFWRGMPNWYSQTQEALKGQGITNVLAGCIISRSENVATNSVANFNVDSDTLVPFYDKRNLVPLGEYIPFCDKLSRLGWGLVQEGNYFQKGEDFCVYQCANGVGDMLPACYPVICYDGFFPVSANNAEWMLSISNEMWFSGSPEARIHWVALCVRCAESGLGCVRATNCGWSGCIDACGRTQRVVRDSATIFCTQIPAPVIGKQTFARRYQRVLYIAYIVLMLFVALGVAFELRRGGSVLGSKKNS